MYEEKEQAVTAIETTETDMDKMWDDTQGEAAPAEDQRGETGPAQESDTFTLKHLDEIKTVGREEVIAYAQKGMDYDRVRAERDRLRQTVGQGGGPMQLRAEAQQNDMENFLALYPEVKAESIPAEVWQQVKGGRSLVSAYTGYENQRLKARIAAMEQNQKNAARAPGSMNTQGERGPKTVADFWDEMDG